MYLFSGSALFEPAAGSGHDRTLYLVALTEVAEGRWFPEGAFAYLPLYPWVAGLVARIFGAHAMTAAYFGIVVDSATALCLFFLARRLGARRWLALTAGLLYAFYPLAVMYSLLTMPNTLNTLGITGFVLLATHRSPSPRWAFSLGLAGGIIALGFAGMLLIATAVGACLAAQGALRRPAHLALYALGLSLPLLPVAWHNSRAEGQFVLLTTHGGLNFYMGNHEQATGYPLRIRNFRMTARDMLEDAHRHAETESGRMMTRAESSTWWRDQARAFWREQPGAALALTAKKALLFWNAREMDDLRMLEQVRLTEPAFRFLPGVPFAVFGLLGWWGLIRARPAGIPKVALLAGMIGVIMFFITARYRLTFVPLLAALGAAGMEATLLSGLRRDWKSIAWLLAGAVVVFFPFTVRDQRAVDHYNAALALTAAQRDHDAHRLLQAGLNIAPEHPDLLFALGSWYYRQEQFDAAASALARCVAVNPDQPGAWFNLALSLARAGRYCEGADALRGAGQRGISLEDRTRGLLAELQAACQ
ncbi:MAG TPA: glycosyltransferase family 39 protein [Kiritimatiellia bacterium]|nr:glycosyltransferase family 39 protein [Kiritimatiellia bacterium]